MEKHSMRHLLWAALFLLYCSCGCLAAVVQQLPQKGESALQAYTVSVPASDDKNGEDWKPIRIGVYTRLVEEIISYCERTKHLDDEDEEEEFGVFNDFCERDDHKKMTTQIKDTLFKDILPKAIKLHTDRLKVKREEKSLNPRIAGLDSLPEKCRLIKDPLGQQMQYSVDVDFMIYVALSAKPENVEICTRDEENRPTSAVISFIPDEIKATRQYIRLTAHEIAHGLGFDYEVMETQGMIEPRKNGLSSTGGKHGGEEFYMNSSETLLHCSCCTAAAGVWLLLYSSYHKKEKVLYRHTPSLFLLVMIRMARIGSPFAFL
ncbi:surface protease GP63 [Trypanosoma theileri]|uniref:Leishmanolysin-like peptidase n=1 Tax=Trypanosoma theileri TaxID=67003 RepID=A0A1X0NKD4_9TRYP|nr:surface protease GP63 [Trypanosoma theileri]ORC84629.1 surface protease GP63 [Trypanosoma theileri]